MKIAILNASSQKEKNELLYRETLKAVEQKNWEVINLGVFSHEEQNFSYVQIALCVSVLLESQAADFVVTGCSSGTGMMLACNSLPGVICGYINNPTDAYLFGRINAGNAISFPLGLGFGWAGEISLRYTLEKLFEEPFGIGYPPKDINRKRKDTQMLKAIKSRSHRKITDILSEMDKDFIRAPLVRTCFRSYIDEHGKSKEITDFINFLRD